MADLSADEIREVLAAQDWADMIKRLVRYALWLVNTYRWNGHFGGWSLDKDSRSNCVLPSGVGPEDLVNQAVEKMLLGTRPFDPTQVSVYGFLCGTIRSDVDTILNGKVHKHEAQATTLRQPDDARSSDELLDDAFLKAPDDLREEVLTGKQSPLDAAIHQENHDAFMEFHASLKMEPDLQQVLDCSEIGASKPSEIAELTGKPVKEINLLNKKLVRRYAEFVKVRVGGESAQKGGMTL